MVSKSVGNITKTEVWICSNAYDDFDLTVTPVYRFDIKDWIKGVAGTKVSTGKREGIGRCATKVCERETGIGSDKK